MKTYVILSAIVALATTIGHFTMGYRSYVKPMLAAKFDDVAKRVMLSVFHYISAFLLLSTVSLFLVGFGVWNEDGAVAVVYFIAFNFFGFAAWQLVLAFTSSIPNAPFKMFQWVFFLLVALLALLQ